MYSTISYDTQYSTTVLNSTYSNLIPVVCTAQCTTLLYSTVLYVQYLLTYVDTCAKTVLYYSNSTSTTTV